MNLWMRRLFILALIALIRPACGGGGGGSGKVLLISQSVTAATGGTVVVADPAFAGTQVDIPAGALAADTTITISQVPSGDPDVLKFEFGPDGTTFSAPVTVTVSYLASYLTNNGISDPATLHVVGSNLHVAPETFVTSAQDTVNHTISIKTTHFTDYAARGYTNATLSGDYEMIGYMYETSITQPNASSFGNPQPVPLGFSCIYGTMHFNGAGGVTETGVKRVDNGSPFTNNGSGSYSIAADGTFSMSAGASFSGSVLSSGNIVVFSSTSNQPQMTIAIKKGGATFSNASLSGDYGTEIYMYETGTTQPSTTTVGTPANPPLGFTSTVSTLTFDGAGSVTATGTRNTDGTTGPDNGSDTYSVTSGGTFSMTNMTGTVLAGGSVLIWVSSGNNQPQIAISLKKSGTLGTASLKGDYGTVTYHFENGTTQPNTSTAGTPAGRPLGFISTASTLTFDGAGNVSVASGTRNTDGTASADSGSGTYSVDPDGTYHMSAGSTFSGLVLDGGSVLIWASLSNLPQIGVSILKK